MKKILYTCFFCFIFFSSAITQNHKVLFIGIDGCRSDVLTPANTPAIGIRDVCVSYIFGEQ